MEVIIRNWDEVYLTHIMESHLKLTANNNEEVITEFYLSDEDRIKLSNGCRLGDDLSVIETEEYIENIIKSWVESLKEECRNDILSEYSMTDQANMTARVAEINSLCLLEHRDPTEDEWKDFVVANNMIEWIRDRRKQCEDDISKLLSDKWLLYSSL